MSPVADSAGVPFAGRSFASAPPGPGDDGTAPPRLLDALTRFRARELDVTAVIRELHDSRVLIPLVAVRGDEGVGAHGQLVDKTQELSIVTVAGPDGRTVLPAFTSVEAMQRWDATARPIPIEASRVAIAAASEGTPLIVIDPASVTEFAVRASAFEALATGVPWVPCFDDPAVRDAFVESVAGEEAVRAVHLAPGDPQSRLAGPELRVRLSVRAGLDADQLEALLRGLQNGWAADPVIAARVDSIAVTVERVGETAAG